MTRPLRFLRTGLGPAADNIAFTAAMAGLHREGASADTLRLYRYRPSVLLGRSQGIESVDHRACAARGVELARRMTGGGAVYMAPGVLAWDLVALRGRFASLEAASEAICGAVAAGLAELGFDARFRAPGDVLIGDRKVSGSAGWFEDGSLLHQGTILVDCDLDEMAGLLRLPAGALPVTTLAETSGVSVSMNDVEAALRSAFQMHLGSLREEAVSQAELARAKEICDEEDWIVVTPAHAGMAAS